MNALEFSNLFDTLYNNIMSDQAPGLDEYEKSVFLTKAQDEIVKAYFNPRLNKTQEGFDGNEKRQIDFSMITKSATYYSYDCKEATFDTHENTKKVEIKEHVMFFINEYVLVSQSKDFINSLVVERTIDNPPEISPSSPNSIDAVYYIKSTNTFVGYLAEKNTYHINWSSVKEDYTRERSYYGENNDYGYIVPKVDTIYYMQGICYEYKNGTLIKKDVSKNRLTIVPLRYQDYFTLMSRAFTRPNKNQAWRLLYSNTDKECELIISPESKLMQYSFMYIKKPKPILVGYLGSEVTIEGEHFPTYEDIEGIKGDREPYPQEEIFPCELDPILHEEIVQRAVELAKGVWEGSLNSQFSLGQNSETNMGIVTQSK